jgi:hypothetical protein
MHEMETTPLQRFANLIGFVAYNFAVGGGLPDRELLAAAMQEPPAAPAAEPAPSRRRRRRAAAPPARLAAA